MLGYGASNDAYHISAPLADGAGAAMSMRMARRSAGLDLDDIDYINAHGTSTPLNDKSETAAIKAVFAEQAYKIPISSTKSMTGHLLGASGAVEALVCVKVLQEHLLPPTINYETPDPDCDLDYVPNTARTVPVRHAMSNSFGFGGHNANIILSKLNDPTASGRVLDWLHRKRTAGGPVLPLQSGRRLFESLYPSGYLITGILHETAPSPVQAGGKLPN